MALNAIANDKNAVMVLCHGLFWFNFKKFNELPSFFQLPVDPISGICHVTAGSPNHSLILHGTLGFFCFIIVTSAIYVSIQKRIQERKLERSLSNNDIENNQTASDAENLLIKEENQQQQKNKIKKRNNNDDERDSYTLEHGLGDGLFSDYWLGKKKYFFFKIVINIIYNFKLEK